MSEEYNDEEFSGLTYAQKLQLEELIIDTAFRNSFKVITKETKFEDLLDEKREDGMSAVMAHQPEEEPSMETLENMMAYFVETEEYEKCAKIRDIITDREIEKELKEIIPNVRVQGKTR
jgi:excinuclease UvrABC helicase subunit UvrB